MLSYSRNLLFTWRSVKKKKRNIEKEKEQTFHNNNYIFLRSYGFLIPSYSKFIAAENHAANIANQVLSIQIQHLSNDR